MLGELDENTTIKEENESSYQEEIETNENVLIQDNIILSKEDNSEIHQTVYIKKEELSCDEDNNITKLCDVECGTESPHINGHPMDIDYKPAEINVGLPIAVFLKEEHDIDMDGEHLDRDGTEEMFSNRANVEETFGNHFLSIPEDSLKLGQGQFEKESTGLESYVVLNRSDVLPDGIKQEESSEDESNCEDFSANKEIEESYVVLNRSDVLPDGIKQEESSEEESNFEDTSNNKEIEEERSGNEDECTAVQQGILCQCPKCKDNRKVSNNKSENKKDKPYACTLCNLKFQLKSRLNYHIKKHEGIKLFPCNICAHSFTGRFYLNMHQLTQHSSGPSPFKTTCKICCKELSCKSSLSNHMRKVHSYTYNKTRLTCQYCSKSLADKKSLKRHVAMHLKKSEYICDHCGHVCYVKEYLITHIRLQHLKEEPVTCDVCGRVCKNSQSLTVHKRVKHSENVFSCELCGKLLFNKLALESHRIKHSDERPFVCQTCGKTFKRETNLIQHQRIHSSDRPHICDICGQSFRHRTHVKQHMAVHGMGKTHNCLVCNKFFARKKELKLHMSVHDVPS